MGNGIDGTILLPLKEKYLTPKNMTGGKYKGRTGNSHNNKKKIHTAIAEMARKRGK
jgi:hypothetical protein